MSVKGLWGDWRRKRRRQRLGVRMGKWLRVEACWNGDTWNAEHQTEWRKRIQEADQLASGGDLGEGNSEVTLETWKRTCEKVFKSSEIASFLSSLWCLGILFLSVRTFFFQIYQVDSGSMEPTLRAPQMLDDDTLQEANWIPAIVDGLWPFSRVSEETGLLEWIDPQPRPWISGLYRQRYRIGNGRIRELRGLPSTGLAEAGWASGRSVEVGEVLFPFARRFGDCFWVDRVTFHFRNPRRGDLVLVSPRGFEEWVGGRPFVKRLIGRPGDQIRILDQGLLEVNGVILEQGVPGLDPGEWRSRFLEHHGVWGYWNGLRAGEEAKNEKTTPKFPNESVVVRLGLGEWLVLGDDTTMSLDSRVFGPIEGQNILGLGRGVIWPWRKP